MINEIFSNKTPKQQLPRERSNPMHCNITKSNSMSLNPSYIPYTTSNYWAVFDANKKQLIHGQNQNQIREIASLTKIMTCLTAIQICRNYKIPLT